jgi:hypothetical protein
MPLHLRDAAEPKQVLVGKAQRAHRDLLNPSVSRAMIIQRLLFTLCKFSLWLSGSLGGAFGGYLIGQTLFGTARSPLEMVAIYALSTYGLAIGVAGSHFGFVLPLNFIFPNARKMFSWESKDPPAMFRFYQRYGRELQDYGAARERGDS